MGRELSLETPGKICEGIPVASKTIQPDSPPTAFPGATADLRPQRAVRIEQRQLGPLAGPQMAPTFSLLSWSPTPFLHVLFRFPSRSKGARGKTMVGGRWK